MPHDQGSILSCVSIPPGGPAAMAAPSIKWSRTTRRLTGGAPLRLLPREPPRPVRAPEQHMPAVPRAPPAASSTLRPARPRSRSPCRASSSNQVAPPQAPLVSHAARRGDAPPLYQYTRGSRVRALEIASDPEALRQAVVSFEEAEFAAGTRNAAQARKRLWSEICEAMGDLDPTVMTPDLVK